MDERKPSWFDARLEEDLDPASREAIAWFNRLRADAVSDAERADFQAWLHRDPAHPKAFQEIEALWSGLSGLPEARRRKRKAVTRRTVGKGVLALALAGGAWGAYRTHPLADYRTGVGERRRVTLADGSRAELATATALSMQEDLTARRVTLHKGEAFFEVAAEGARPFVVEAGHGRITALGTAFAVADAGGHVLVTVTQHAVQVETVAESLRVEAGTQVAFDAGCIGAPVAVDEAEALAWREGRLVFVNARLDRVVEALNRWRTGHLAIMNGTLAAYPATLIVNLEDIEGALGQLEDALPLALTSVTPYLTLIHAR